jgi:hypothetical protein
VAEDLHLFSPSSDVAAHYAQLVLTAVAIPGTASSFALILWSRLHLVYHNKKLLRGLLVAIILTGVPVWACEITGYTLLSTQGGNVELGRQLLHISSYIIPTVVIIDIAIMMMYMHRLYQISELQSWKDPAIIRLLGPLIAAMAYILIFSAACIGTILAELPIAHAVISVGFALTAWVEYGVLLHVIRFSSRVQRGANHFNEPVLMIYDDGRPRPLSQMSSGSAGTKGTGFMV